MNEELNYKETLRKNLQRVDTFIEDRFSTLPGGEPLPIWIEISPIDLCNRTCVFCPKADDKVAPNQKLFMPRMLFEKIASELKTMQFKGTVMLAGYGEPLYSPEILPMVRAFSEVANTEVTTNGDPLNIRFIQSLVEAGIGKIIISLYDGPHQIDHYRNLFSQAGVSEKFYILRDRWYGPEHDFGVKLTNRAGMLPTGNQREVDTHQKCYYPHYSMMVDWNGDVFLCTQDWNRRIKSGNLALSTVLDVWCSPILKRYRNTLMAGSRTLPPCNQCNANGTLHGKRHAEAWSRIYSGTTSKQSKRPPELSA